MLNDLVDGCIVISSDGYVEFFNKAAEKIFGYRAEEVGFCFVLFSF
jgi:PAS domain S-box-containing protein